MNIKNIIDKYKNILIIKESTYLDSLDEQDAGDPNLPTEVPQNMQQNITPTQQMQMDPNQQINMQQPGIDPNMVIQPGMDPNQQQMGIYPSMMGGMQGTQQEIPRTSEQIGRLYEMNKIYARLYAIDKILKTIADEKLEKTKKTMNDAFDIYRMVLNNYSKYKDKMDEIILRYYDYIGSLTNELKDYFESRETKNQRDNEKLEKESEEIKNIFLKKKFDIKESIYIPILSKEMKNKIKKKYNLKKEIEKLEDDKIKILKKKKDTTKIDGKIKKLKTSYNSINIPKNIIAKENPIIRISHPINKLVKLSKLLLKK